MTRQNSTIQTISVANLLNEISGLAKEFPHRAICSFSDKTNTYFYNVYFQDAVDEYIEAVEIDYSDTWQHLGAIAAIGYTIKVLPKNKSGFAQCTFSYEAINSGKKECHLLSGEGGQSDTAIVSALMKHILISRETGDWAFTMKEIKSDKKFR